MDDARVSEIFQKLKERLDELFEEQRKFGGVYGTPSTEREVEPMECECEEDYG